MPHNKYDKDYAGKKILANDFDTWQASDQAIS